MAAIKDKLVELVAINMAKERYGNSNKAMECYIEAEDLFKDLLLRVLAEKANGDPQEYVDFLENVEEVLGLDYYDIFFIESMVFGN